MSNLNELELKTEPEVFTGYVGSLAKHYEEIEDAPSTVRIGEIKNRYGFTISQIIHCSYDTYKALEKNGMIEEDGGITFIAELYFKNVRFAQYKKLEA
jgi:hypothetical protein